MINAELGNTGMDMYYEMAHQLEMEPATEVLQSIKRFPRVNFGHASFNELHKEFLLRVVTPPLKKTTTLVIAAEPVSWKTRSKEQERILSDFRLTYGKEGEILRSKGIEPVYYDITWIRCIEAAQEMGLVPKDVALGDWKRHHLDAITAVARRGMEIVQNTEWEGMEDQARIVRFDSVIVTATEKDPRIPNLDSEEKERNYLGWNRGYSLVKELLDNPDTRNKTFVAAYAADEESRQEGKEIRGQLLRAKNRTAVKKIIRSHGFQLHVGSEEALDDLQKGGATPHAINVIGEQSHWLWYRLALARLIPSISSRIPLGSFERFNTFMKANPGMRTRFAGESFLPRLIRDDLGVPHEQALVGYVPNILAPRNLYYDFHEVNIPREMVRRGISP